MLSICYLADRFFMITNISLWAALTISAIVSPIANTPEQEPIVPETTINSIEDFRALYTIPVISAPAEVKITFDKVSVTSIAAPKPEPKVETPTNTPTTKTADTESTATATTNKTPSVKISPGSAKAEAANQLSAYGWGADQLSCLVSLWEKESNWNSTAENPSSGAYGIPQSLPGNKMASAGSDWRTNPATQIKWGLGYIKDRYKTPCGAWNHSIQVGWY